MFQMDITLLCVTFVILSLIVKFIIFNWRSYLLSWQLPGPLALPIIGNALEFFCEDDDIFDRAVDIVSRYESPMRFWFGPQFTVVFSDPERASKVLSSMNFITKHEVYRFMKEFAGEGLITASGPKWKSDRKVMAPLFLRKNIVEYFDSIVGHTNTLVKKLDKKVDGPKFNIEIYLHRCAADIVNETIIGVKTNAQDGQMDEFIDAISRMYEVAHARIIKVWLQVEWIFRLTHYYQEQEGGRKHIHGLLRNMLHEVEERRLKSGKLFESMLDRILEIREKVPNFATEDELVHHLLTFYSASEDTVTTVSAFTLWLFGMYPDIQNKVSNEINEVLGKRHEMSLEDISNLTYLQMCIKDVLRLFPVAPFIMRKSSQNFRLEKWLIPKGCAVVVAIHNIHRDPSNWEKPNEFYPEHFLPEAVEKRHKFSFLPFSAGPRSCVGKQYAYLAMTVLIAKVVRKYIVYSEGKLADVKLKTDISVRTRDHQYPIRLKRRDDD